MHTKSLRLKKIIILNTLFCIAIILLIAYKYKIYQGEQIPVVEDKTINKVNIILVAMPKSASVYVSTVLTNSLNTYLYRISPGYFPNDNLSYQDFTRFLTLRHAVTKTHIDASAFNRQLLNERADKIVLLVRDPRAVLLSWVHYINRIYAERKTEYLYHIVPTPPEAYYRWDLHAQIDWHIDNFYPNVIVWLKDWLSYKESQDNLDNGITFFVTTYEELINDEQEFFRNIIEFSDIPDNKYNYLPPELSMKVHYRKGDPNEWRQVFTDRQIVKVNSMLPNELKRKFKWPEVEQ